MGMKKDGVLTTKEMRRLAKLSPETFVAYAARRRREGTEKEVIREAETTVALVHGNGGDATEAKMTAENYIAEHYGLIKSSSEVVQGAIAEAVELYYE